MHLFYREFNKINDCDAFVDVVYNNFIYLTKFPELMHTREEIKRILKSDETFGCIIYDENNNIVGYLIGEFKNLNDNRYVYYISYFYILQKYRSKGIGKIIMKVVINKCTKRGIKFVMLTCDLYDGKIVEFYKKMGFVDDPVLNSKGRHRVMTLFL
jgi:GNAT superfamily N-acetyltransferase